MKRSTVWYFLFLFVFTLGACEIAGRVYLSYVLKKSPNPKFQFNYYRIYSHIPGFREGDGEKDWIVINDQGFRRSENVSKSKDPQTVRIFLMGGSAAHGISSAAPYPIVHIYQDETIDHYLEQRLKQKYPGRKVEVINAAVTGYQVFQHTDYLLSELLDYQPDAVVFFDGINDHYFNNPAYDYYGENKYMFWKDRLQSPSLVGGFDYFMLWLSEYSGFARGYVSWRLIKDALSHEGIHAPIVHHDTDSLLVQKHREAAKKQFLRSMEMNIMLLKQQGIKPLICLQPILALRDSTGLSKEERAFFLANHNFEILHPVVREEVMNLTGRYNVPCLDLNPAFNDNRWRGKQLYIDYCHLTPLGGEVAAQYIAPALDSLLSTQFKP